MLSTYVGFALIAALVVVSPGPVMFLLLKNTSVQGRRAGLLNTAGVVVAVLTHATLSLVGVSAVVLASPLAFLVLKLSAAGYLSYVGLRALRDAWRGTDFSARLKARPARSTVSDGSAFAEGWFTNILNPKPSMFYLSVFPQFLDPSRSLAAQGITLAGLHAAICATWFSLVVLGIDGMRALLHRPRVWRALMALTGFVFIALAARVVVLVAPG